MILAASSWSCRKEPTKVQNQVDTTATPYEYNLIFSQKNVNRKEKRSATITFPNEESNNL